MSTDSRRSAPISLAGRRRGRRPGALWITLVGVLVVACLALSSSVSEATSASSFDQLVASDLAYAQQQIWPGLAKIPFDRYPSITDSSGQWETTDASQWTSGFLPGELWLMYELTGNPSYKAQAEARQAGIETQQYRTSTHDLGFMLFTSFGNGYRLTGNPAYKQVLLNGASSLSTRYSPVVGLIRSWNNARADPVSDFKVIVDNMMNLNLLWWGSSQSGGHSSWYQMALHHSQRTIQNFIRPDGSTYHEVIYNAHTGAIDSTIGDFGTFTRWSRGQAWAIYGFTQAYEATHDPAFLATAEATADYLIGHLPSDGVPYWDFDAASTPNAPRDSSAAAIAASALVELAQDVPARTVAATKYLAVAQHILTSLSSPPYLSRGTSNAAILLRGISEPARLYSSGLSYGDYYFLEALLRYRKLEARSPRSH